ncbi:hypothetical protein INT47_005393 [Mucor saturninus]|uniref:SP-RING-type domain-containing protein n=1 Tax=Mucor saturninus TaxID=64648 RepID=A0A8H7QTX4_9FUNG|nr:hypothetical protein INT47_005393 [Mucor saturninus]
MTEQAVQSLAQLQNSFHLKPTHTDLIKSVMGDSSDVIGFIRKGQQYITIEAMDQEEANNQEKILELDASYRELMDLESRVRNQNTTFTTLATRINNGEILKNLMTPYEEIQTQLQAKCTTEEEKYLTNEKYIDFRQNIWNINHPDELMPSLVENDDDDIVMGSTKISLKCPLTTTWLEDPVTSTVCKHSFSKAAILDLMRQSGGSVVCPVSGCNKGIVPTYLINDEIMAERVTRVKARDEKNASSTQFFDVE